MKNLLFVPLPSVAGVAAILCDQWGKLIFIVADLACAILQHRIIKLENPETSDGAAVALVAVGWLFNPITAVVSVRGNAEALIGLAVLASLLLLIRQRLLLSGLCLGLAVHLKLYPVIYAAPVFFYLAGPRFPFLRKQHIRFGLAAFTALASLTWLGYAFFGGWLFLHKAYLYHVTRVDIKHNFSLYFYAMYLLEGVRRVPDHSSASLGPILGRILGLAPLIPMAVVLPIVSFRLRKSPSFAWFQITHLFVTFNKYFLWSLALLPCALACLRVEWSARRAWLGACLATGAWLAGQWLWLAAAYQLELVGLAAGARVWINVWLASLAFFLVNVALALLLMRRWRGSRLHKTAKKIE